MKSNIKKILTSIVLVFYLVTLNFFALGCRTQARHVTNKQTEKYRKKATNISGKQTEKNVNIQTAGVHKHADSSSDKEYQEDTQPPAGPAGNNGRDSATAVQPIRPVYDYECVVTGTPATSPLTPTSGKDESVPAVETDEYADSIPDDEGNVSTSASPLPTTPKQRQNEDGEDYYFSPEECRQLNESTNKLRARLGLPPLEDKDKGKGEVDGEYYHFSPEECRQLNESTDKLMKLQTKMSARLSLPPLEDKGFLIGDDLARGA